MICSCACSLPDIIQEIEREEGEKQKRHLRRVTAIKEKLKSCPPRLGKRKYVLFHFEVKNFNNWFAEKKCFHRTSDFKGIFMVITLLKMFQLGAWGFKEWWLHELSNETHFLVVLVFSCYNFSVDKKIIDLCDFRFVPAPAQVLLSEEITGSLRKLKVAFLISIFSKLAVCIFKFFLLCYLSSCFKQGCCTLARDRFKSLEKRGLVVPSKKSSRLVKIASCLKLSHTFWFWLAYYLKLKVLHAVLKCVWTMWHWDNCGVISFSLKFLTVSFVHVPNGIIVDHKFWQYTLRLTRCEENHQKLLPIVWDQKLVFW